MQARQSCLTPRSFQKLSEKKKKKKQPHGTAQPAAQRQWPIGLGQEASGIKLGLSEANRRRYRVRW